MLAAALFCVWCFLGNMQLAHSKCEDDVTDGTCEKYKSFCNTSKGGGITDVCKKTCGVCVEGCLFGGKEIPDGSYIENACALLKCNAALQQFQFMGYDNKCIKCTVWGDPHISTYGNTHGFPFGYQGLGVHTLSRPMLATGDFSPRVQSKFIECGRAVSCANSAVLINDAENTISMDFFEPTSDLHNVTVNGETYNEIPTSPTTIGNNDKVLFWKDRKDLLLIGSSNYLIKASPGRMDINIYIPPAMKDQLWGLCVSPIHIEQEQNVRKKREEEQTQSRCEKDSSIEENIRSQCKDAITPESNLGITYVDDCVFDMCRVDDPEVWLEKVVKATVEEEIMVQKMTVECEDYADNCEEQKAKCESADISHLCKRTCGICI